jgi:glycosyltransferase A (GT-A) superfamily protein (DUF2064 family)
MLEELESTDVVLSPDALDGTLARGSGYGLIGMRRPVAGLFAHAMSTPSVLADTIANAASQGLSTKTIEPSFDIDTAADLVHLAAAREEGHATLCPRVLRYLDENDLWPTRGA